MPTYILFLTILTISGVGYLLGRQRVIACVGGSAALKTLHSRPPYYGMLTAIWAFLPTAIVLSIWMTAEPSVITKIVLEDLPETIRNLPENRLNLLLNDLRNFVDGNIVAGQVDATLQQAADHYLKLRARSRILLSVFSILISTGGVSWVLTSIRPGLRARNHVERIVTIFLIICSTIAIFTTFGIVMSVLFEAIRFFKVIPLSDFLFGLEWSPQMAIRADQVGSSGAFGAVPVFAGTMMVSTIAMFVAVPIGLMSAIYLSEYATKKVRAIVKPLLEVLAGIPTVVYGFFAALTMAPFFRNLGESVGLAVSSESALAAGLVMGVMIIPFVSSLSDDVIHAVPQAMRDGSYGLGATKSETIRQVVIPAALPGIVGGILLAVSRAIGETMIVVMAAGLSANLTANPLKAMTTVTVQIVTLLVGDQEFDSPKTLAAFALGLVLFIATLILNVIALQVVRKYREQYE